MPAAVLALEHVCVMMAMQESTAKVSVTKFEYILVYV